MDFDTIYGAGYNKSTFYGLQYQAHDGAEQTLCYEKFGIFMFSILIFNCVLVLVNIVFVVIVVIAYKKVFCNWRMDEDFDIESLGSSFVSDKGRGFRSSWFNSLLKKPVDKPYDPTASQRSQLRKTVSQDERHDLIPAVKRRNSMEQLRLKKCVSFEDEPSPRRFNLNVEVHDEFQFADADAIKPADESSKTAKRSDL
ncbi:unnamed protein product [Bursaphelenchus okinawaensis]|uniref:Uncharacterized protein n=1 Tax=Bursaphelenchus okinawaensis TaxID=465554 RepID=A0A811L5J1_9BILA|nr:unnamed protein product [Bursaphelenchus okinawaensis]CAG9118145.1 unnamed protein product [Bursaphelenchus okinawaensis]